MNYLGDFLPGDTIHLKWNSCSGVGASITRATNGTIYVYQDDATGTEVTTGVTDTEDHDSRTGIHHCKVVTTDAFYTPGHDYFIVLTAATIDGQTVNACLGHFSLNNRLGKTQALFGSVNDAGPAVGDFDLSTDFAATADLYNGMMMVFLSGALVGQNRKISDYTVGRNAQFTGAAGEPDAEWPAAPANGDKLMIVGRMA